MLILGRVGLGHFTCGSDWVGSRKLDLRPTLARLSSSKDKKTLLTSFFTDTDVSFPGFERRVCAYNMTDIGPGLSDVEWPSTVH